MPVMITRNLTENDLLGEGGANADNVVLHAGERGRVIDERNTPSIGVHLFEIEFEDGSSWWLDRGDFATL